VTSPRAGVHGDGELERDEPYPGIRRASLHTPAATVARYEFSAGATFPIHHHPQTQIVLVERGEVVLRLADETLRIGADGWAVVPPDVPHGLTAGDDGATAVAVVVPGRSSASDYVVLDEPVAVPRGNRNPAVRPPRG
jgi:quercetin dioxygenase-like cupin family protein